MGVAGLLVVIEINARIVPELAIARIARLHADKRGLGSIAGALQEYGRGRIRASLSPAVHERSEGGHTTRLPQLIEDGPGGTFLSKRSTGRRILNRRLSALQQLGFEERHVVLEGVRLWSWNSAFYSILIEPSADEGQ